jgi:hypothetical protein
MGAEWVGVTLMAVKTMSRDRNIEHWDAEDSEAWQTGGA